MVFEDLVQFRISAFNVNGWGLSSETNSGGARVRTAPRFMNPPQRFETTNDNQIYIYWASIETYEDTGGSVVISYGLQWDSGTDGAQWSEVEGYLANTVATEFTVSQITPGKAYRFRL